MPAVVFEKASMHLAFPTRH